MKKFIVALLLVTPVLAQNHIITPPQINLTGNTGCQGFPCVNTGTLVMATDADRNMTAMETSALYIKFTSSVALTATRNLIAPLGRFPFSIQNATTGGQSIQIIGPTGLGVIIPNGQSVSVWNNGTDFIQVSGLIPNGLTTSPGGNITGAGTATFGTVAAGVAVLSGPSIQQSSTTSGTEGSPITSSDGTAGIQAQLNAVSVTHGGMVNLAPSAYQITTAPRISLPGTTLEGVFGYGLDSTCGGGCAPGTTGTKLIVSGTGTSGLMIGNTGTVSSRLGGVLVRNLYFSGSGYTGTQNGLVIDQGTDQTLLENINTDNVRIGMLITGASDSSTIKTSSHQEDGWGISIGATNNGTRLITLDGSILGQNAYGGIYLGNSSVQTTMTNIRTGSNSFDPGAANPYSLAYLGSIWMAGYQDTLVNSTVAYSGWGGSGQGGVNGVVADGVVVAETSAYVANNSFNNNTFGADIHVVGGAVDAVVGPNSFTEMANLNYLISSGTRTTVNINHLWESVCNLQSDTVINAPNGYMASCPIPVVDGVNYVWGSTAGTVTNSAGAEQQMIALFTPTTANSAHNVNTASAIMGLPIPTTTVYPAGYYAFSVNVKAAGYNYAAIELTTSSGTYWGFAKLAIGAGNCTAGTIDSGLTLNVSVLATETGSAGWCQIQGTVAGQAVTSIAVAPAPADNTRTFAGDGVSGIQIGQTFVPVNTPKGIGGFVKAINPQIDGPWMYLNPGPAGLKMGYFAGTPRLFAGFRTDSAGDIDISAGSSGGISFGYDNPTLYSWFGAGDVLSFQVKLTDLGLHGSSGNYFQKSDNTGASQPAAFDAAGNLTAGTSVPTKSGTPTAGAGVCWKTASVLGTCTAGTWPNCTTCN